MSGYWAAFFLGFLKSPIIYVQGFIVYFLSEYPTRDRASRLSKLFFLGALPIISCLLYFLLGSLVKWTKEDFSLTPYIFFLYLFLFCLLYEGIFCLFGKKRCQKLWSPLHFILLFVPVAGIFYTTEIFGAPLLESIIFILGQCFGICLFVQGLFSLYRGVTERYYGPKLLKNPLTAVFLSIFFGELILILQFCFS